MYNASDRYINVAQLLNSATEQEHRIFLSFLSFSGQTNIDFALNPVPLQK
jgi:hypothetical protein